MAKLINDALEKEKKVESSDSGTHYKILESRSEGNGLECRVELADGSKLGWIKIPPNQIDIYN